ncbi:MAG: FAD-binding oxidoreductase [Bacteroidota bacterium]
MSKYHLLTVQNIKRETVDAVSVTFDVPKEIQSFFKFIQGQYVTLKLNIQGEHITRSYSICSSPFQIGSFSIGVKKVNQGKASSFINDSLKIGDKIEVMEPNGRFYTELDPTNHKQYYLFGGGSGITPMVSIIKAVLEKEPNSTLTLFYGNRNVESIIFKDELTQIATTNASKVKVVHILSDASNDFQSETGIMSKEMNISLLQKYAPSDFSHAEFFVCGPEIMMNEAKAAFNSLQIPTDKIHIEYFTAKTIASDIKPSEAGSGDMPEITSGKSKVTIKYDGNTAIFDMDIKQTILEAALDAGYDPPFSCMVAACCTCRAKITNGKVHMDDRESLTDAEINDGYVLTCQSHPKTAFVELDYDV